MPRYNVAVAVVEIVEAADSEDAVRMLRASLTKKGFEVYEGPIASHSGSDVFQSEEG